LSKDIEFEKRQETKKKQLILTINHELKTPVSVIKGMVEGMLDNVGRYKDKETYLKEVLTQLDKVDKMTKDLTYSLKLEDLAKVDDVANLKSLNQALSPLLELADQKKVKLSLSILDQPVRMNEELLGILAANLLKNAINYTKDAKASFKTYSYQDIIYLEVRNKGEIKAEDLAKIFEPYYRIEVGVEGSGLGLFIVRQICEIYHCGYKIYNDNGDVVSQIGLKKA
jgi:two-component system sensor histidine kinase VanS